MDPSWVLWEVIFLLGMWVQIRSCSESRPPKVVGKPKFGQFLLASFFSGFDLLFLFCKSWVGNHETMKPA